MIAILLIYAADGLSALAAGASAGIRMTIWYLMTDSEEL